MNEKALAVLEYNKITELLRMQTGCPMSEDMAAGLSPYRDMDIIAEEQAETTEAVALIVKKGTLPTGGIYDVSGAVSLARKGGCLTMKQLLEVKYDLSICARVKAFLKEDVPEMKHITGLAELLEPRERLEKEIDRCILSEDEMADSASSELRSIRRQINQQNDSIRSRLSRMAVSTENQKYLQDSIVTIKDGRYVIPVKQEHRGRFPGIVHDQSKGGATLFIEPQAIVEMNNRLRELEVEEQAEIARILRELSDMVAECHYDILNNQNNLVRLDYIMAKGKLSLDMDGSEPSVEEEGPLLLKKARHPLIQKDKVVPVDVSIGEGYSTLVVTGPNTGGKTVTLKTAGLLSMMALSGLHIPALPSSRVPLFTEIYADIGDEQSIEQSLSTFSSHMKNIVNIAGGAQKGSLVLLDELGAGTDPTEGAALAIAILEKIYGTGAMTIATTHYNELKKYALSTEGIENASMEFDVETLTPTYRLITGTPGRSNAFEIAGKLGLDPEITARAAELIQDRDMEFEDVVSAIDEDRRAAEDERSRAEAMSLEIEEIRDTLAAREKKLSDSREKILAEARAKAREIIRDAQNTAGEVQKELRELTRVESLGERTKGLAEGKRKLKEKEKQYAERLVRQVNSDPIDASSLKVGDKVKVLSLDQSAEVLSLPDDKGDLQVQMGIMKATVNVDDLMLMVDGKKTKARQGRISYGNMARQKAASVKMSLNVQGENLDSAVADVEKYIDDAFVAGLPEVTIIHGRGEGILKTGIRSALKRNKHVASHRAGNYNEGGDGVTLVKLKTE